MFQWQPTTDLVMCPPDMQSQWKTTLWPWPSCSISHLLCIMASRQVYWCQDVSGRVRMLEFQSSAQLAVIRAVVSSAPRGAARGISIFCIASIPIWHVQCAASYSLPEITGNSGFLGNQSFINWLVLVSVAVFGNFKGKTLHHPMHVDVTCRSQGKHVAPAEHWQLSVCVRVWVGATECIWSDNIQHILQWQLIWCTL